MRKCGSLIRAVQGWLKPYGPSMTWVDPSTKVMRKVEKGGKELKRWNRDHFGNVRKELAKKRRLLLDAEKEAMRSGLNHRVMELKREITELKDKKNRMWFQRAKV